MGFTESIRTVLKQKYATFSGRASRSEYWWFSLFYTLVLAALFISGLVIRMIAGTGEAFSLAYLIVMIPAAIFMLALIIPFIALQVRRFHDRNLSGWWYLLLMVLSAIPYVGFLASIASLVITILKGTDGPNKFGADPLRPAATAEVFA
ncbi:DUF805 domain-containing protein [Brucella sp. BE17]|uniref:DUF805 domain-containing protein n=1 Tax=Brucella sp. BE17 TaxID=3142977 RepID=UPI0031BBB496